jgi:ABC-type nitrate/sulfonate/bicarbonate transport system ATPase subunit
MENLITADKVSFRYLHNDYLFNNLSLKLKKGEVICLTGKSGSGKSTLLRILAGLMKQEKGDIKYTDSNLAEIKAGFVFQDPRLLPWRTVKKNIELSLEGSKISKAEKELRVSDTIIQTKLSSLSNRYPHQLSGGQQQRVSLARALVTHAPLLLLDEPFSALDLESKEEMIEILKPLIAEKSLGIILVTHDLSDIEKLGAKRLSLRCNF